MLELFDLAESVKDAPRGGRLAAVGTWVVWQLGIVLVLVVVFITALLPWQEAINTLAPAVGFVVLLLAGVFAYRAVFRRIHGKPGKDGDAGSDKR